MSLQETKEILNIDQQNIIFCEVVQDFDAYSVIRTDKGKQVRAGKPQGLTLGVGSQVEVRTDQKVYNVVGPSQYADTSAEQAYSL